MLRLIMVRKEGKIDFTEVEGLANEDKKQEMAPFRIQQLFKKSKDITTGVIDGMVRTLGTSRQNSPLGMALKGLRE